MFAQSGEGGSGIWVGGGIVAIVSTVALFIINFFNARHKNRQEDLANKFKNRQDELGAALDEYKEYISHMEKENKERMKAMEARVQVCETEVRECQKREAQKDLQIVRLEGEMRLQQAALQRLQMSTGRGAPVSVYLTTIIADLDGKIWSVDSSIGPLLHWSPKDLIGKSIEVLIPPDILPKHREGFERIRKTGELPWAEKIIIGDALSATGERVPVKVQLVGWRTPKGQQMISATVRRWLSDMEQRPNQHDEFTQ